MYVYCIYTMYIYIYNVHIYIYIYIYIFINSYIVGVEFWPKEIIKDPSCSLNFFGGEAEACRQMSHEFAASKWQTVLLIVLNGHQ